MAFFSSGNHSVDELGKINIMGNVTPQIWYKKILNPTTGKPYLLAIAVLSDIVYWYRPRELRDEMTGNVIGWGKKFQGDLLQKSYGDYAELYGESKKTIREAMECLESMGIIRREFRNVKYADSMVACNVLFIDLCVEALYEITYPENQIQDTQTEKDVTEKQTDDFSTGNAKNSPQTQQNQILPKWAIPYRQNGQHDMDETVNMILPKRETSYEQNGQHDMDEMSNMILPKRKTPCGQNGQYGHTEMGNTYTENTTEITNINKINHINQSKDNDRACDDMIDVIDVHENNSIATYIALIKENLDYDHHMMYDNKSDNEYLEEIFNIICDIVCVKRDKIKIGKVDYPYELVKSRFLKIKHKHVEYVISNVRKETGKITNIRAYIITALYNAPTTFEHYISQLVNHDMYGGNVDEKTDI